VTHYFLSFIAAPDARLVLKEGVGINGGINCNKQQE
jgi:hypothetical protein